MEASSAGPGPGNKHRQAISPQSTRHTVAHAAHDRALNLPGGWGHEDSGAVTSRSHPERRSTGKKRRAPFQVP